MFVMIKDLDLTLIENVVTICGLGSSIRAVTSIFRVQRFLVFAWPELAG